MTKYREIIRLAGLDLSQTNIALSCSASKTTVIKVLKAAREKNIVWPLEPNLTDVIPETIRQNRSIRTRQPMNMPNLHRTAMRSQEALITTGGKEP